MSNFGKNPFAVKTPETMDAQDIVDLFVPFSDYYDIQGSEHTFVHGHRGCGKSMMFRFMSPECQTIHRNTDLKSLPYYGAYLPIKSLDINFLELLRLEDQVQGHFINEHFIVAYFVTKIIDSLKNSIPLLDNSNSMAEILRGFFEDSILRRLKLFGWEENYNLDKSKSLEEILTDIIKILENIHTQTFIHLKKLYKKIDIPFSGPLFGFQDFLLPIVKELKSLDFMPDGPIYLLIDDADNLPLQQTEILNTWVSFRTTKDLSLKISTQLTYKTYRTINGKRIETPHDYSELTISNIYTGSIKQKYPQWLEEIVDKRLKKAGINTSAREFFPTDKKQEAEIAKIAQEYKDNWKADGRGGSRPGDDAYRNARPEYIKRLGKSHQRNKYKYAGFDQLVHISSGIIRFFLDPAGKMFSEEQKNNSNKKIDFITPQVQDTIIREAADDIMHKDFDNVIKDFEESIDINAPEQLQKIKKMRNLINGLGNTFFEFLISDRSERRVFSFAVSDELDAEVREIIKLAIEYGYIYETSIGTKEGRGRTPLYVLTRRIAPFFSLDPNGFSSYKFVTSNFLRKALMQPKSLQSALDASNLDDLLSNTEPLFKNLL